MDYGFAQFSHRLIYARAVKTHIITSNHHQVIKVYEFGKKKFLLVNHNTRINTEDRERETRLRGTFQKRTTFPRVEKSSSFSEEYRDCEREREFSFSFIHTSGGSITIQNYMSLPFTLCFVLEKQREKVMREKENAIKSEMII